MGEGGFALAYFFDANTSVETGPVGFNDGSINGNWTWSIQLDFTFPVCKWIRKIQHCLDTLTSYCLRKNSNGAAPENNL